MKTLTLSRDTQVVVCGERQETRCSNSHKVPPHLTHGTYPIPSNKLDWRGERAPELSSCSNSWGLLWGPANKLCNPWPPIRDWSPPPRPPSPSAWEGSGGFVMRSFTYVSHRNNQFLFHFIPTLHHNVESSPIIPYLFLQLFISAFLGLLHPVKIFPIWSVVKFQQENPPSSALWNLLELDFTREDDQILKKHHNIDKHRSHVMAI